VCEYSPSQQHFFFIVSHKPNNKGIVRVCPLRNITICFHIKINPNLSNKRFSGFLIVYIPFPENQMVSFFLTLLLNDYATKPTSYESVLGTFIKKLKVKGSSFFLQI
jgi:hypothetical protein